MNKRIKSFIIIIVAMASFATLLTSCSKKNVRAFSDGFVDGYNYGRQR